MKTITSVLTSAVAALVIAAAPIAYGQTASSAPENNKTDDSASKSGSMGDATPKVSRTDTEKTKKADTNSTVSDKKMTSTEPTKNYPNNDSSREHTGTADQTKAALSNRNAGN